MMLFNSNIILKMLTTVDLLLILTGSTPAMAALEIIGTGYGRTGTNSLRIALNELGYKT